MAAVRVICPNCKQTVATSGVPRPGEAVRCDHCGASFPMQFARAASTSPAAVEPARSGPSRGSLLAIFAVLAVGGVVAAVVYLRPFEKPALVAANEPTGARKKEDAPSPSTTQTIPPNDNGKERPHDPSTKESSTSEKKAAEANKLPPQTTTTGNAPPKPPTPAPVPPPTTWSGASAVLFLESAAGDGPAKAIAVATAVAPKRFVTRALPVLATGVKDPQKDQTKLTLSGTFGKRPVTRVVYHPSLPIAKLAEGNLAPDDYLAMMRHDAALLIVEEPVMPLDAAALGEGDPAAGPATVVAFKNGPSDLQLADATIGPHRPSNPLAELRCDAGAGMEGAAVYSSGRLAGILLVNLGPDGKPTAPHALLPATRIRELLAQP
jgi:hypothetical protein